MESDPCEGFPSTFLGWLLFHFPLGEEAGSTGTQKDPNNIFFFSLPLQNCSFQLTSETFSPLGTFLYLISSITSSPGLVVKLCDPRNTAFESHYFKKNIKNLENSFFIQQSCLKEYDVLWTQRSICWMSKLIDSFLFFVCFAITNPPQKWVDVVGGGGSDAPKEVKDNNICQKTSCSLCNT